MKNLESFISKVKKIKLKLFIETYDKEKIQHRILKKKHPKIMYIDKGVRTVEQVGRFKQKHGSHRLIYEAKYTCIYHEGRRELYGGFKPWTV